MVTTTKVCQAMNKSSYEFLRITFQLYSKVWVLHSIWSLKPSLWFSFTLKTIFCLYKCICHSTIFIEYKYTLSAYLNLISGAPANQGNKQGKVRFVASRWLQLLGILRERAFVHSLFSCNFAVVKPSNLFHRTVIYPVATPERDFWAFPLESRSRISEAS